MFEAGPTGRLWSSQPGGMRVQEGTQNCTGSRTGGSGKYSHLNPCIAESDLRGRKHGQGAYARLDQMRIRYEKQGFPPFVQLAGDRGLSYLQLRPSRAQQSPYWLVGSMHLSEKKKKKNQSRRRTSGCDETIKKDRQGEGGPAEPHPGIQGCERNRSSKGGYSIERKECEQAAQKNPEHGGFTTKSAGQWSTRTGSCLVLGYKDARSHVISPPLQPVCADWGPC